MANNNVKRPTKLLDFIGQTEIKKQLHVLMAAALAKNNSLAHMIFNGPPGVGKTTLAQIIANEMNVKFTVAMATDIKNEKDVEDFLVQGCDGAGYDYKTGQIIGKIKPNILFLDEIHRLKRLPQEYFYPILENFELTKEEKHIEEMPLRVVKEIKTYSLPKFTLIGATTEAGLLERPFRDRFGLLLEFRLYNENEIVQIIQSYSIRSNIPIQPSAAQEIAKRSRGVARISLTLFERCKDVAVVNTHKSITSKDAQEAFSLLELDPIGLTPSDIKYLRYLAMTERPIGLSTIAEYLGMSPQSVSDIIEPHLMRKALIQRTPRGRWITPLGIQHLETGGIIDKSDQVMFGVTNTSAP